MIRLDKRSKFYKTFSGYKANDYVGAIAFGLLAGLLAGIILYNSLNKAEKTSPRAPVSIINPIVVEAKEVTPTITPTPKKTKKYTYTKYSKLEHYDEVISYLKELYVNWEDGAELVARESSFSPHVVNSIGACGLVQSYPCHKMKCPIDDTGVKCQLDWQKEYVKGRYGTITKALDHSLLKNWY